MALPSERKEQHSQVVDAVGTFPLQVKSPEGKQVISNRSLDVSYVVLPPC